MNNQPHEVNMGDIVAKLYGAGTHITDSNGDFNWDKILSYAPVPDSIKKYSSEYCRKYYNANNTLPSRFFVSDDGVIFDDNGVILYNPQPLPSPVAYVPASTPARRRKNVEIIPVVDVETKRTLSRYTGMSVFNPLYFPYGMAFNHRTLWAVWVVLSFLGKWTVKGSIVAAKAAILLTGWSLYLTWVVVLFVMKYGLLIGAAMLWKLPQLLLWILTLGFIGDFGKIMGRKKRRRRRRW